MKTKILVLFLLTSVLGWSQHLITGTGVGNTYTQNFDTFRGTAATLSPISNWSVVTASYNTNASFQILASGAATPTVANISSNTLYAGRASSTSTDYSILQKQATSGSTTFTFNTVNNTGSTISGFVLGWNVEQFNLAGRATTVQLSYSINGGAYVTTGITGTNLYTCGTGTSTTFSLISTNRSVSISGLTVATGATINFRYSITNGTGSGSNALVGIDDFSVYATSSGNTVTFDANGGTGTMANQTASTATALTNNAFTRTGYTFAGWSTTAGGAVAYTNGASYPFTANATLYAVWTPNNNTITFDANGGTGTMGTQTIATNATANLNTNTFTRSGFTFAGWATTAGGAVAYTNGASYTMGTANVTLYAQWTAAGTFTVTFNDNGGTGTMANQTTNIATPLTNNAFSRTGYTFAGWATTAGGTVVYTNGASYPFTANATLYAVWTPNSNTITFDANGGTGSMSSQSLSTDAIANLNTNTYTRTGFTFAGWSTTAGGTVAYLDGASYTMGTTNVILYAQWTAITYSITFDGNGFTGGSMSNQTIASGASASLTLNGFTRTGYAFDGWSTSAIGSVVYTDGASYTMGTADVTLYAQWSVFVGPCFSENFASITTGNNTTTTGSGTAWANNPNFPTGTNDYQAGGAVKLGTGSAAGSITSAALSGVSGNVTVSLDVKGWSTVEGDIRVTLNGVVQTQSYTAVITSPTFENKQFTFINVPTNSTLIIATTAKRAFVDNIILTCSANTLPEINLVGNTIDILNGDSSPSVADDTDFGTTDVSTGLVSKTFTIQNIGSVNLNLTGTPIVEITGVDASDFSVTTQPSATTIAGLGSLTFVVSFNPSNVGLKSAAISIANDDTTDSENPYTFSIQGTGVTPTITSSLTELTGFTYVEGFGPSTNQTFTVSGSNLTANLVLTAPTNYEINTAATGTFLNTLSFTPTSGNVATTTIYVRLKAGLVIGNYNLENINCSSTNATTVAVTCSGSVTAPAPEIDVERSTLASIPSGSTASAGFDTIFAAQNIGNTAATPKTYTIRNEGTAVLTISDISSNSSEFVIGSGLVFPLSIAVGATTTFTVAFTPNTSGVRNGIISLANDDSNENPYTFEVQGTGNCGTYTNTLTPASGPVGTEVTITASSGNLTGATVTFNGVTATPTQLSATQLSVIVPSGASTGSLVTLNSQGCSVSTFFTVITNEITSCQAEGSSNPSTPTDLFISQVTDSNLGSLTYVEIYNATGTTKNISDYSIQLFNNGSATVNSTLPLTGGTILNGQTFVLAIGADPSPPYNSCSGLNDASNGSSANQINTTLGGINFPTNGHDHIRLYNLTSHIDSWGVSGNASWANSLNLGTAGVGFSRINTAVVPNTVYSNSDWIISDWATCADEDYTEINNYVFSIATPPTITVQPSFGVSCSTQLSVVATEGYNGGSDTQELAYQWYAVAPLSTTWVALTDTGIYSGATTETLTISSTAGVDSYQYYCQVRENGATCYQASNAVKVIYVNTATTWNGIGWSNLPPTATSAVTFEANYTIDSDFTACTLNVTNNAIVSVDASIDVNLYGALTVATGSSFILANNANLVQTSNASNSGTIVVNRESSLVKRLDYTLWSSPVTGAQTLKEFSPATLSNRFYTYNTLTNAYSSVDPLVTTFGEAQSYLIRVRNTHSATIPTAWNGIFNGNPNNGPKSYNMTAGYNAVGNPYPSRINIHNFIDANPTIDGTLYFWRKTNDSQQTSYATITKLAYVKNNALGGDTGTGFFVNGDQSNWVINIGQGFIVNATSNSALNFTNQMRRDLNANQFFRNSENQSSTPSLYWLNLTSPSSIYSQMAVGYTSDATLEFDRGIDGKNINSEYYLTSLLGADEFTIQGRPEFQPSDIIYLSYKVPVAGEYTIAIDATSGLFSTDSQTIYLKDNLTNSITDLKNQSYTFTSDLGVFANRFEVVYQNTLGTPSSELNQNTIKVFKENDSVVINSGIKEMASIQVFDIRGRLLIEKEAVDATYSKINLTNSNEVLVVKITFADGQKITKKIIF